MLPLILRVNSALEVLFMETQKPKLLDQVRCEARLRHLSLKTERAYIYYIRRYIFSITNVIHLKWEQMKSATI